MHPAPLTTAQRQRVKSLFDEACEMAEAAQAHWLAEACADDAAVKTAVENLLQAAATETSLLDHQVAAELLALPLAPALGQTVGPYRLLREIGQGGMGTVYLAERTDDVHHEPVALKLVRSGLNREAVGRFQRERELLARLNHPNIARLLDGGDTETGWLYLVMDYVEGQPITRYCREHRVSLVDRLKLFRTVCEAVQFAHRNLIVHRDLKPDNLFVTASQNGQDGQGEKGGTPKLLDFGIAKLLESDAAVSAPSTLTRASQQPFTPLYASPEQIRNEPITTASDVYSLGVVLYELLTEAKPYRTATDKLPDIIRAVCEEEPLKPSAVVKTERKRDRETERQGEEESAASVSPSFHLSVSPSLPFSPSQLRGDLDNIVLKALHKEAAHRYTTVEQFSDDLLRYLSGEPVTARPATLRYRAGKYVRRNQAAVAAASVLLLALLLGALVTLWQLRASQARERQQRYELYAADMRQAGADWGEGNLVQMDALLEAHRPGTRSDEWRGFEWFALWKLLHTEKFTLPHQAWVPTVLYTPDGKTMLTGSRDGRIEMWDAHSGQSRGLFTTFPEGVYKLVLTADGKKLAATGNAGLVRMWDFESRRVIAERSNDSNYQTYLAFSPDGQHLALKINDGLLEVWDTTSGQRSAAYALPSHLEVVADGPPLYAPNGRLYVLTRQQRQFALWDIAASRVALRLDPHSDDPSALVTFYPTGYLFSPDGQRLYLPTRDFMTRAWDARNGKLLHVFAGHQDNVETPLLSSDSKLLATGSDDKTLRLWDTQTGQLLATVRNESQTFSPAFSPDNKSLAAVCMRAFRVKVWAVAELLETHAEFTGMRQVFTLPDGKTRIAEDALHDEIGRYGLAFGPPLTVYPIKTLGDTNVTSLSPDGKWLASIEASNQPTAVVLEVASGKKLATLTGHRLPILAMAFSPDGKTLATTGQDRFIKLWDTATWRERASWQGHTDKIWCVSFSPDGRTLATSGYDDTVRVWDAATQKELLTLRGHRAWVRQITFSPDGKLLASASWDYTAKLWDAITGHELHTLTGHANSVYAVAFSPDGKRLASGGDDRTVRIWDVQTGEQLTALHGHTGPVWQVAFTPDDKTLVSSSAKETCVWRAATMAEVQARR